MRVAGARHRPAGAPGDRDHEPARDDGAVGAPLVETRRAARSSGRIGGRAERCAELPRELVRARTGLVPDPYFSASKLEWLLARTTLPHRELAFGTIDAWLVWKLTDGRIHATDHTNASRTMLLDLDRLAWDDDLLALFGVDRSLLPDLHPSSGVVGEGRLLGQTLPIAGIAGDQQAALFGQACFHPGQAKATYGTGSFVLAHVGSLPGAAPEGLLKTAVAVAPGAPPEHALEGAILASGAAIQWLRDGLGLIADAAESESLAEQVDSTDGVYFVPALAGLGSPHWDPEARGLISGITRGTTRAHVVRAALEAIAFQVADVIDAVPRALDVLRADGGASANRFLMQFQADVLGGPVDVAREQESTAVGAASLAGLATGIVREPGGPRGAPAAEHPLRARGRARGGAAGASGLALRDPAGEAAGRVAPGIPRRQRRARRAHARRASRGTAASPRGASARLGPRRRRPRRPRRH